MRSQTRNVDVAYIMIRMFNFQQLQLHFGLPVTFLSIFYSASKSLIQSNSYITSNVHTGKRWPVVYTNPR